MGALACAQAPLRVGTSGDYAPFSVRGADGALAGMEVELARAFARGRGRPLVFVPFLWPELAGDLRAGRFDVAMSGVTVRPERSVWGRFTRPWVESGAVALVADAARHPDLASLDAPGVRIAVNAGGHLERAARARFPRARILALPDNEAVPEAVRRGDADAAVSDTLEAPSWLGRVPGLRPLGPFTLDRKAWWLPADAAALADELDAWLAQREADGTLDALRARHLGAGAAGRPALPLEALAWTLRERLELMPLVAEAKRARGLPVEAPGREADVTLAAARAARDAARETGREPPPEARVRALFRAQIEAAKAIQRRVLAGPPRDLPRFDLDADLRPALLRLGSRIAALLVELPPAAPEAVRAAAAPRLALADLPDADRERLVEALVALAQP